MTDAPRESRSIRSLQAKAEKGNLLSGYQLYEALKAGKLGIEADPQRAKQQFKQIQDAARQSQFRLNNLSLYAFRRYLKLDIDFDKQLTVIVGENGAGKTSIVESIAKLLSWFASRCIKANNSGSHLGDSDINVAAKDYAQVAGSFTLNKNTYFTLSLVRPVAGGNSEISSELQAATLLGGLYRLLASVDMKQELPVLAYYPVERSNLSVPSFVAETRLKNKLAQRFSAYAEVSREQAKSGHFIEQYLVLNNLAEAGSAAYKQQLQQVNQAIEDAVPYIKGLHVDRSSGGAEIRLSNFGSPINFSQLSQGQKILAAMVGDLALRMIALNPHMSNPLDASGIVLIDEIDLHLHPRLQQQIIPGLQQTFANVQWIITTHSPQVLSTVDNESIRNICFTNGQATAKAPDFQTKGVISSDVLEQIMGIYAVPDIEESCWISRYEGLIQEGRYNDTQEGLELREKLINHFGANHPVMEDLDSQVRLFKLKQKVVERQKGANGA